MTRLLGPDPRRNHGNHLEMQAQLMQQARQATADSRRYNRERLRRQANAGEINVGDSVMVKAREPLSLTAKWDFGFIVTRVNGKVLTILHPTTGVSQRIARDQVRKVDPDIVWEDVTTRPRRMQARPRAPLGARPGPANATPAPAPCLSLIHI